MEVEAASGNLEALAALNLGRTSPVPLRET